MNREATGTVNRRSGNARVKKLARAAAAVAVILVCLDALGTSLGSINIRLYMLPALVVIVFAAFSPVPAAPVRPLVWLLSASTILATASIMWTDSLSDTVQVATGQIFLIVWCISLVRLNYAGHFSVLDLLRWLLFGCVASAVVALGQVLIYYSSGVNTGVWLGTENVPWPRPNGLTREPVWAALNSSTGLILALTHSDRISKRWKLALVALFVVVLALTFSRAAIISLGICLIVWLVIAMSQKVTRLSVSRSAFALVALAVACYVSTAFYLIVPRALLARFDLIGATSGANASVDRGSLRSRLGIQEFVLDNWEKAAGWGHGAGALAEAAQDPSVRDRYAGGGELNSGRGSTNFFLTSMYDGGLVGLAIAILIVAASFVIVFRRRTNEAALSVALMLIAVYVQYLASNGFRLGITWVVFAVTISLGQYGVERAKEIWKRL